MKDIPFFIGLGIHKSASTWIYSCLYEHPDICIPNKDIHFFYLDHLYQKGYQWYENGILSHYKSESVIVDMSVIYFAGNHSAKRIKKRYPNAQLFVCLRHPVQRAWSHYIQDLKMGHISLDISFEEALANDNRYILFGKYKQHFENFLEHFKKEQIKVLLFDDIKVNPSHFIKELYTFIGVNPDFKPSAFNKKLNEASITRYHWIRRGLTKISTLLKSSKTGQFLWWRIKTSGLPKLIRQLNTANSKRTPIPNELIMEDLRKTFDEDILFVKHYLNRPELPW